MCSILAESFDLHIRWELIQRLYARRTRRTRETLSGLTCAFSSSEIRLQMRSLLTISASLKVISRRTSHPQSGQPASDNHLIVRIITMDWGHLRRYPKSVASTLEIPIVTHR